LGESGTGKDVAARAVHRLSRRTGAFVAVNCGAIASELLESELFGAERGAFTGATEKRIGFVRAADKGTLFLDEIGDMPAPVQVALLRVLEQREVVPVGSHRAIPVDFRLICATHRDLKAQVAAGAFRADLYARIAGFDFPLWSLRERREDLGQLIAALLPSIEGGAALTFSPEAVRAMLAHRWPLNIRELHKCLALASVLADTGRVELSHLPDDVRRAASTPAASGISTEASAALGKAADPGLASGNGVEAVSPRDRARRERLMTLLDQHAGNVSHVARDMGKARSQVQRWLIKYGLDAIQYRR
jgi:DNA-binding NtrC family response regulator